VKIWIVRVTHSNSLSIKDCTRNRLLKTVNFVSYKRQAMSMIKLRLKLLKITFIINRSIVGINSLKKSYPFKRKTQMIKMSRLFKVLTYLRSPTRNFSLILNRKIIKILRKLKKWLAKALKKIPYLTWDFLSKKLVLRTATRLLNFNKKRTNTLHRPWLIKG